EKGPSLEFFTERGSHLRSVTVFSSTHFQFSFFFAALAHSFCTSDFEINENDSFILYHELNP
ncbi:hypothetical protein, partial [Picosynechococcus sp. PCC 7002]|uniref:hypothetical protein n=1 Tax=Picosynechococcus sp. (strain ATCC 27264 / PCC 7002 / PR-6) TaxID=32049 RepID=UPI001C3E01A8